MLNLGRAAFVPILSRRGGSASRKAYAAYDSAVYVLY